MKNSKDVSAALSEESKKELLELARSESFRRDFERMRENSAARAPKTTDELIRFLRFTASFGGPASRWRPIDSGHCRI